MYLGDSKQIELDMYEVPDFQVGFCDHNGYEITRTNSKLSSVISSDSEKTYLSPMKLDGEPFFWVKCNYKAYRNDSLANSSLHSICGIVFLYFQIFSTICLYYMSPKWNKSLSPSIGSTPKMRYKN